MRDFATSPLTIPSTYSPLRESILRVLTNRHPIEPPLQHDMLRAAVRETSDVDFCAALSELTSADLVQVEWGTGSDHKRTGYYSATRRRTANDNPSLEPCND